MNSTLIEVLFQQHKLVGHLQRRHIDVMVRRWDHNDD